MCCNGFKRPKLKSLSQSYNSLGWLLSVNMLSSKAPACCYGGSAINRKNSGATNLQGFFFNGKENSKTKNILFICNYGNTNTRKTQEDCVIRTWKVFYGGFKERRVIQWNLWSKEGKRKKFTKERAGRV